MVVNPDPKENDIALQDSENLERTIDQNEAQNSPSFNEDFILLSEFSELEGPVPLWIIPDKGSPQKNFNINDFVLRITSVDNQNKPQDNPLSTMDSKDTQMVITQSKEEATAYVHHFSLLDIFARGYLRPVSMSYITRDAKKIMNHFDDFLAHFNRISETFKRGNRRIFRRDLSEHLVKLGEAKEMAERSDTEKYEDYDPETMEDYIRDLQELHNTLCMEMDFEDEEEEEESEYTSPSQKSARLHLSYFENPSEAKLRTLHELCGNSYHKARKIMRESLRMLKRPAIVLALEREDQLSNLNDSVNLSMGTSFIMNFSLLNRGILQNIPQDFTDIYDELLYVPKMPKLVSERRSVPLLMRKSSDGEANTGGETTSGGSSPEYNSTHSSYGSPSSSVGIDSNNFSTPMMADHHLEARDDNLYTLSNSSSLESVRSVFKRSGSIPPPVDPVLENFSCNIWNVSQLNPGRGLLDLRNRLNPLFFKCAIFSLMKGRPVVIYGLPASEIPISKLVSCLSTFIPMSYSVSSTASVDYRRGTLRWLNSSLKLGDLSHFKIIGLSKEKPIPKAVEKYITLWDYEQESIFGPNYQGSFIEEIINNKKMWPDENTFLAHLQCIFFDISMKAYFFYQAQLASQVATSPQDLNSFFNDSSPLKRDYKNKSKTENGGTRKMQLYKIFRTSSESNLKSITKEAPSQFYKSLSKNDMQIVEYLVELVKIDQSMQYHSSGGNFAPILQLDRSPCRIFRNTKK
eukprot:TRINITY_DN4419_c0_g2_i1.p1 TRINITY_DN4419_c0_g2~~TRINITY_DN4419_c0_g2_i1.p1  ORF type:complete len:745 (+),score=246.14 TRINITY_DN4419_c0_g2_i1:157-2391(+)